MHLDNMNGFVRYGLDAASGVLVLGALAKILPPLAALLSIMWLLVQFYDRFIGRRKRAARKD